MARELLYTIFRTAAGWIGLLGSGAGLRKVILPRPAEDEIFDLIAATASEALENNNHFIDLTKRLKAYFSGEKISFLDKLDFSDYTTFQCEVWKAASQIPYGETRSYGWIAEKTGRPKAVRAVGQALGRNPCPVIVPCHRVLAGDGGLGGFSGGIEMKKYLLRLEGF